MKVSISRTYAATFLLQQSFSARPMIYVILSILLIAVAFVVSFCMYIRDKRHARSVHARRPRMEQEIPLYKLCSWIDDEVATRKLYKTTNLSAADLANELGISERRLRHTIFNAYDKTVDEYLQDRRIQAACRLLREPSEMTPDEISHESGFASQAAFHAAFKSAMGQTPEQYRNMTRRQN